MLRSKTGMGSGGNSKASFGTNGEDARMGGGDTHGMDCK